MDRCAPGEFGLGATCRGQREWGKVFGEGVALQEAGEPGRTISANVNHPESGPMAIGRNVELAYVPTNASFSNRFRMPLHRAAPLRIGRD